MNTMLEYQFYDPSEALVEQVSTEAVDSSTYLPEIILANHNVDLREGRNASECCDRAVQCSTINLLLR